MNISRIVAVLFYPMDVIATTKTIILSRECSPSRLGFDLSGFGEFGAPVAVVLGRLEAPM